MKDKSLIRVGVVGATGYTGVELLRLLFEHPSVQIVSLIAQKNAGKAFSEVFPAFFEKIDLVCETLDPSSWKGKIDIAFLCLPHHEAMQVAKDLLDQGIRVIDLSADFRLRDASVYEKWYGPHDQKILLKEAIYGLPELYREKIQKARLIASPGCYPTSIILGLAPLLSKKWIELNDIVCDSKSGTSGAGRGAKVDNLFCEINENIRPYSCGQHRHRPEIEQELSCIAKKPVSVLFSPHILPIDRGILSSIYCKPLKKMDQKKLRALYLEFYQDEPFVHVLPENIMPSPKNVRGTNDVHINPLWDEHTGRIVVFSTLDNLTKGASGQAIQSFNIMNGFEETLTLKKIGLVP